MRILLFALIFSVAVFPVSAAIADEAVSPNKQYLVSTEQSSGAQSFPKIVLTDKQSGKTTVLDDEFEEFGQHWAEFDASWSPDSRHVALRIVVGKTWTVRVFSVTPQGASEVEKLPIPAALDAEPDHVRGGEFVDRWVGASALWIGDSSKRRLFRYHFTRHGKLLADKYEQDQ